MRLFISGLPPEKVIFVFPAALPCPAGTWAENGGVVLEVGRSSAGAAASRTEFLERMAGLPADALKLLPAAEEFFPDCLQTGFAPVSPDGMAVVFQHEAFALFGIEIPATGVCFGQKKVDFIADKHPPEIPASLFQVHGLEF